MRLLFTQEPVATSVGLFLGGLLGEERGKTGWMRAEAAGDPGPWRRQAILGRGRWDADALRERVPEYVVEHLADADAGLVIEETGFLKQGKRSGGVGRQYTGGAGKITNRRIGVFAALCLAARSCLRAYPGRRWLRAGEGFFGLGRKGRSLDALHRGKGLTQPERKRPARPTQRLPG